MDYPVVLEHDADGWTALCPVLPGCISEGDTRTEALANIQDAIRLYLRAVRKEMALLSSSCLTKPAAMSICIAESAIDTGRESRFRSMPGGP